MAAVHTERPTAAGPNGFLRNVAVVLSGTAAAQAIPIVGSLVLARLYVPADFGVFSAWLGAVTVASVALTGRFEMTLAIERDGERRRQAALSTLLTLSFATAIFTAVTAAVEFFAPALFAGVPALMVIAAIPTAGLIAAANTWQSWAAAEGRFRSLALMRFAPAACITALQLVAGVFAPSAPTLAAAHAIGVLLGLVVSAWLIPLGRRRRKTFKQARVFWVRHRRFPLLSLPADSINAVAAQLPVIIVASRFGAEVAGLLALAMRTLGAPIALLGLAVLDVFKRHAGASWRERGECHREYWDAFKILTGASIVASIVLALTCESLFGVAFGEKWRGAGVIAIWLLPMFALRFVASPLSYLFYLANKQHLNLLWQVGLLSMTLGTLLIPDSHVFAIAAYSAGYGALYVIYLGMSYRFSLGERQ